MADRVDAVALARRIAERLDTEAAVLRNDLSVSVGVHEERSRQANALATVAWAVRRAVEDVQRAAETQP